VQIIEEQEKNQGYAQNQFEKSRSEIEAVLRRQKAKERMEKYKSDKEVQSQEIKKLR
jgi:hypothetical protein